MQARVVSFEETLRQAVTGNEAAVGRLWRSHHPYLLRWLHTVLPEMAEDVASEVWFEIMKALGGFRGSESGFRSWMFTIARRRVIDQRRRTSRKPVVEAPMPGEDPALAVVGNDEATRAVGLINESLAPDQAEVVLLRALAGLSTNEVADVLGKKPGAVRVLQCRGLRRLAEVLASDRKILGEV